MIHSLTRGAATAAALALSLPAAAQVSAQPAAGAARQEASRANDRIVRLERAVRDLQGAVYAGEPGRRPEGLAPAAPSADTVVRLQQIEREMQELTGRIEELTFRLATQQRQVDTMMEVMAGPGAADGPQATPGAGSQAPREASAAAAAQGAPADLRGSAPVGQQAAAPAQTVELPADPDDAYDVAYEALLAGDYARSQAAFEAYVERFPEGVRTPEAKYLLGEIYLATGAYAQAATQFLDHVRTYPEDPRGPEAYLKLGTSFARLDKADEACRVFSAGSAKFPDASASVQARIASEEEKAGCAAG